MSVSKLGTVAEETPSADEIRVLSESDILRLKTSTCFSVAPVSQRDRLEGLEAIAMLVDPADVPPDVVTMNTAVECVKVAEEEVFEWTLVYPDGADYGRGLISVLSPMGIALLGARCGQTVAFLAPNGETIRYVIKRILHQPESSHFKG